MYGKFTFNLHDCEYWGNELFDTKEEAIKEGRQYAIAEEQDYYYVGKTFKPEIKIPSSEDVIENITESLFEEIGDLSNSWHSNISKDDKNILDDYLNDAIDEWMDFTGNNINYYKVDEIEKIEI